jgi:hypothetical protein
MRLLLALTVTLMFAATSASAQTVAQHTCDSSFAALNDRDKSHVDYKAFIANCEQTRQGWEQPPSPTPDSDLSRVTGLCADGNYTSAMVRSQACLGDGGGVTAWFAGNYTPSPMEQPAQACADGSCAAPNQSPAPTHRHSKPTPTPHANPSSPAS